MPMYDYECGECGARAVDLLRPISQSTIVCPSCGALMTRKIGAHQVTRDDIPGGLWLENYGPNPVKVYSHTERKRLANQIRIDDQGREYVLTEKVEHVGVPGTDRSPHTTRWDACDAVTLANAVALVSRSSSIAAQRDAEQAERDYHDPLHHPINETGGNARAIFIQQVAEGKIR